VTENTETWFVVNFFSGTLSFEKKQEIITEINKHPNCKIFKTDYPLHAAKIAQNAVESNIKTVVAVGGDGTLNEVGGILKGTNVQMGIVPIGSGNGLARHLKIPLNPIKAIQKVFEGNVFEIDTCMLNEFPFLCTAGVGFDAQVAYDFSQKKTRGFLIYILSSIQTFFGYKGIDCQIVNDSIERKENAFAITFANASQYGNDAVVAPESSIDDGLIDMVILKPFSVFSSIFIAIRLFTNSFSKSKFVTTIKGENFELTSNHNLLVHFDGEPKQLNTNKIVVKIDKKKLKVIC
jgi:diacylglycerol kinase (ATP)